jgi:hypothetical protein
LIICDKVAIISTRLLEPLRKDLIDSFLLSIATRDIFLPPEKLEKYTLNLWKDLEIITLLEETCYLNEHPPVPKLGNIELACDFSKNPSHHHCFINMLRVSPLDSLLFLISLRIILSSRMTQTLNKHLLSSNWLLLFSKWVDMKMVLALKTLLGLHVVQKVLLKTTQSVALRQSYLSMANLSKSLCKLRRR